MKNHPVAHGVMFGEHYEINPDHFVTPRQSGLPIGYFDNKRRDYIGTLYVAGLLVALVAVLAFAAK